MKDEIVLSERELKAMEEGRKSLEGQGVVIVVRMFLKTEGQGTFRIDGYDTAQGNMEAWLGGAMVSIAATPATGWKFTYWDVNGNYVSDKPNHSIVPQKGATITAHFEKA